MKKCEIWYERITCNKSFVVYFANGTKKFLRNIENLECLKILYDVRFKNIDEKTVRELVALPLYQEELNDL